MKFAKVSLAIDSALINLYLFSYLSPIPDHLLLQHFQSSGTQRKQRRATFTPEEEKALCVAFVRISNDAAIGKDQSSASLWQRIYALYLTLEGVNTSIATDPKSLQKFFSSIQSDVMLYVACLANVGESSGTNPIDWIQNARNKYLNDQGKAFANDHCFEVLRVLPKYDPEMARHKTQMSSESEPRHERPIGRKAEKEMQRGTGGSRRLQEAEALLKTSNEYLNWHKQAHQEKEQRKEERIRRMEKKWDALAAERRTDSENLILFMDTRHMNQMQVHLHEQQVQSILARRNAELGPSPSNIAEDDNLDPYEGDEVARNQDHNMF